MQAQARILCLDRSDVRAVHPAHLPCTHTQRLPVVSKHDGVGFDEFGDTPGKQQIACLLRGGLFFRHHLELRSGDVQIVGRLHQQPAADALVILRVLACMKRDLEHADIGFLREYLQGIRRDGRSNQHFHELLDHRFRRLRIELAVEGDDAAEGRSGIGGERQLIRLQRVLGHGDSAGVGVLDDDARALLEGFHAFPRRVGIGDIVVREFLALQLGIVA